MKFKRHIFVCTNQKEGGRKCCGYQHGMNVVQILRDRLREDGLNLEIRAQRAGCLSACALGPAMVVYPEGVYYGHVETEEDVNEIYESHVKEGKVVERLKLDF